MEPNLGFRPRHFTGKGDLADMPPQFYRIRIAGHLSPEWSTWFDGWDVAQEPDGTTTLSGLVPDQAALHGLLMRVRDLGIVLEGVEHVTSATHP